MTKKPKLELYPICKVEEYSGGKVSGNWWSIKTVDGTELLFKTYKEAETFQQENKLDDSTRRTSGDERG